MIPDAVAVGDGLGLEHAVISKTKNIRIENGRICFMVTSLNWIELRISEPTGDPKNRSSTAT